MNPDRMWMNILENSDRPELRMVIKSSDLPRYQQAAESTNTPLQIVTQSGEVCYLVGGGSYVLPDGKIEVEIRGSDLSSFWRSVEESRGENE